MSESKIYIRKEAGQKKDAIRVSKVEDIPEFLRNAISITGDTVRLDCVEGEETSHIGEVIAYEKSASTSSGYNCWVVGNAATSLVEKDGVFYKKTVVYEAQKITDEYPEFLSDVFISHNSDGSWSIKTSWGTSTGLPGEAYWVKYGQGDANILTKTEKSYGDYIVCEEDGTPICKLASLDPA